MLQPEREIIVLYAGETAISLCLVTRVSKT